MTTIVRELLDARATIGGHAMEILGLALGFILAGAAGAWYVAANRRFAIRVLG